VIGTAILALSGAEVAIAAAGDHVLAARSAAAAERSASVSERSASASGKAVHTSERSTAASETSEGSGGVRAIADAVRYRQDMSKLKLTLIAPSDGKVPVKITMVDGPAKISVEHADYVSGTSAPPNAVGWSDVRITQGWVPAAGKS
jgi:hypothetical protein